MEYWVYVIQSQASGKIYIGQTGNLERRLLRHNQKLPVKKTSYTAKNKGPWQVVYKEKLLTRKGALTREKALKGHQGREFIKKLISGPVAQW